MSWFSNQWNRWSNNSTSTDGSLGGDPNNIRRIEVIWGRERLQIVLPRTIGPVTLAHLKHEIASITSLPYERIKLIHKGLIMKDDRSALSAYGLREGSRIGLVGSREEGDKPGNKTPALSLGEQKARERKAREADTSEEGLMGRITEALDIARKDLFPDVHRVEASLDAMRGVPGATKTTPTAPSTTASAPAPVAASQPAQPSASTEPSQQDAAASSAAPTSTPAMSREEMADAHRRLSELLLRQLLALDSVAVNSETTRQARKLAVKEVQSHLDRLDEAWNAVKQIPQQPGSGGSGAIKGPAL
ncbi:hypothetical protein BCV70DRAFT_202253 [Testicularia cyperi]|uniref:Uncharacterized protein n=1 Tax=Testicularia cyperi TaxID=1882483 RepID=A0A317XL94_9BASI|nr:hypothetical protein BCV70DRAFT_202253 [Testicularia cyperi]